MVEPELLLVEPELLLVEPELLVVDPELLAGSEPPSNPVAKRTSADWFGANPFPGPGVLVVEELDPCAAVVPLVSVDVVDVAVVPLVSVAVAVDVVDGVEAVLLELGWAVVPTEPVVEESLPWDLRTSRPSLCPSSDSRSASRLSNGIDRASRRPI